MKSGRIAVGLVLAVLIGSGAGDSRGADGVSREGGRKMDVKKEKTVRCALGGGRWFPADKKELGSMVGEYIKEAKVPKVEGRIMAVMAPHAGFIYSGKVAGHTFRAVQENVKTAGKPDVVVVIGFGHRAGFPGVALMDGDILSTPLGDVELDVEAGVELAKRSERIVFAYEPHEGEHSAENEIPFVQSALPGVKIVVAIIGDHDARTIEEFVSALKSLSATKKVLVVASTDMLHDASYDLVTKTDRETLKKIEALDHESLAGSWTYSRQVLCGIGPVLTAMKYAEGQGCKRGTVVHYRNSGDDFPESRGNWVVGYGSVVFAAD
jgi:AmmeMemoRadiSam system protein B